MPRKQRSANLPLARKLDYRDSIGGPNPDDDDDGEMIEDDVLLHNGGNDSGGGGDDDDDDQTPVDRDDEEFEMNDGGDGDEDDDEDEEEEEHPEVVAGGDNDFFTVNHVASIQVNNNNNNNVNTNENDSDSNSSQPKQPQKKRIPNGILKKPTNINGGRRKNNGYDDRSDDSAESDVEIFDPDDDIEELKEITTSPYLKGRSAEKNEEPFVRLKRLLHLPETAREAVEVFDGRDPAWATIKSFHLIEKSGMVYSQHWREGLIHGENFGKIPNHILVLILQPMRFVKASETDLSAIVKELEVHTMIQAVVSEFELEDEYPLVMSTDKIFHFSRRKRDCYRSALFLARLASCCKRFKMPLVGTYKKKAIRCLDILEEHIIELGVKSAVSATQVDDPGQEEETIVDDDDDDTSVAKPAPNATASKPETTETKKKKRGRPPKRASSSNSSVKSDAASLLDDGDGDDDGTGEPPKKRRGRPAGSKNKKNRSAAAAAANITSTKTKKNGKSSSSSKTSEAAASTNATTTTSTTNGSGKGRRSSNKSSSALALPPSLNGSNTGHTLQQLIGRFEQKYQEMGEILEQIKTVAADSRSPTEQQIRDEVLEEVKSSLLGSLPKK